MTDGSPRDDVATGAPDVSVVIPVYEQPELLAEALDSVAEQTYDDLEVVVVDDASSCDYDAVLARTDLDVRLLVHDENRGAGAARNTGIEAARGTYVAFLDADDTWKRTKLERQRQVFEAGDDGLGLVYTGFVQYELDGTPWERLPNAAGDIYVRELERDRVHPTSTVMVRRACVDRAGGFDSTLPSRQDYDLWIRITEFYTVDYVDDILVEKREQPEGISKQFRKRLVGDWAVYRKVRRRTRGFNPLVRGRILSYHHHVIGRDYDSGGERPLALWHLGEAILRYPFRPVSWAMFVVVLFRVDRNGRFLSAVKSLLR